MNFTANMHVLKRLLIRSADSFNQKNNSIDDAAVPNERMKPESLCLDGQVLMYGLQGSGNVIAQHIYREIIGSSPDYDPIKSDASQSHLETVEAVRALADEIDGSNIHGPGYGRPGYLNAAVGQQKNQLIFPEIRSRIFLAETVYGTHALPEFKDIQAYKKLGGKVLVVLRHPLDVMTSIATKSVPPDLKDRINRRNKILNNAQFVSEMAWQIEEFWRAFWKIKHLVTIVRYEDILASPYEFVRNTAEWMNKKLSKDIVSMLSSKVGTAELAESGHLFQARANVWKKSMPESALPYFEKVKDLSKSYGYDWDSKNLYKPPVLELGFHVSAYSFRSPKVQKYLTENNLVHFCNGLPFVCKPDSPWVKTMDSVGESRPELIQQLTTHCDLAAC